MSLLCRQCGGQVGGSDRFCGACGSSMSRRKEPRPDPLGEERTVIDPFASTSLPADAAPTASPVAEQESADTLFDESASPGRPARELSHVKHAALAQAAAEQAAADRAQLEHDVTARAPQGKGRTVQMVARPKKASPAQVGANERPVQTGAHERPVQGGANERPAQAGAATPSVEVAKAKAPPAPVERPAGAAAPWPAGTRVQVRWADGKLYPGVVQQWQLGRYLIGFGDGHTRWIEAAWLLPS